MKNSIKTPSAAPRKTTPAAIVLPLPPEPEQRFEMDVYVRFMRHMRNAPTERQTLKILSSIQFVADMLNCSDAHIAKVLVDFGLRAPREAFPAAYLNFVGQAMRRTPLDIGGAKAAEYALTAFWEMCDRPGAPAGEARPQNAVNRAVSADDPLTRSPV